MVRLAMMVKHLSRCLYCQNVGLEDFFPIQEEVKTTILNINMNKFIIQHRFPTPFCFIVHVSSASIEQLNPSSNHYNTHSYMTVHIIYFSMELR